MSTLICRKKQQIFLFLFGKINQLENPTIRKARIVGFFVIGKGADSEHRLPYTKLGRRGRQGKHRE